MKYHALLPSLRERTHARPDQIAHVRRRLDLQLAPARAELARLPGPSTQAVARVSARLRQARSAGPSTAGRTAPLAFGLGALAFAAMSTGAGVAWQGQRAPQHEQLTLSGFGSGMSVQGLQIVEHDGRGELARDGRQVTIDWEYGVLRLSLDPERALQVAVRTPEGRVDLTGTDLVVERSALGTSVTVGTGTARVACGDAPAAEVSDETTTCLPLTAAGWLNRLRRLEVDGLAPADLIAETDLGLATRGSDAEVGEIWTVRLNAQIAAGQTAAALDSAERALSAAPDAARAEDLRRTAARLALALGDCARAVPHLDQLPSLQADEQAHRDRCVR